MKETEKQGWANCAFESTDCTGRDTLLFPVLGGCEDNRPLETAVEQQNVRSLLGLKRPTLYSELRESNRELGEFNAFKPFEMGI